MKILLIALALSLSGCATIISGTSNTVHLTSEPSGASVSIDGRPQGKTPLDFDLPSVGLSPPTESTKILFELDGYEPKTIGAAQKVDGWVYLNVLNLFLGGIVDLLTDATYEPEFSSYHADLREK